MNTNVQELHPLDRQLWQTEFEQNPFYQTIASRYTHSISSYYEMTVLRAAFGETVYEYGRNFLENNRILDIVPYYYIDYLLKTNPATVVDLGCGINSFKPHIPGLIGIDADYASKFDIHDRFDEDFVKGQKHVFDALISINCIHFSPIDSITQRLKWASQLIKPGCRGFVSFNIETWLMYTPAEQLRTLFGSVPDFIDVVNYVNDQILASELDFLVVDWPVLHISEHSSIRDDLNGNIRLVFETKK